MLAVVLTLTSIFSLSQSSYDVAHAQQAAPELRRIGPDTIAAGGPTFTIRLEGKNFADGAQVVLDGVALPSSRTSSKGKLLLAEVDASVIALPGTHSVQAVNPDGSRSATLTLTVVAQDPELRIRLSGNAAQEDTGLIFEVELIGEGFNENTDALIWGFNKAKTKFVDEDTLIIQILPKFTTEPAFIPIMVRKNGRYSNTEIFFVVPKAPSINNVKPDTVRVGTEDFDIEVVVDGLKPDAQLTLNGVPLQITRRRSDRLEATVPASFIQQPALLFLRIEQDGIQSSDAFISVVPTDGPFIFAIAPNRVRVGERKPSIDIIGANLGENRITVLVDGEEAKIKSRTGFRLTVAIPEELSETTGTHTIQVRDRDGNVSNISTFEVVPDVIVGTLAGDGREGFDTECVDGNEASFRRPRRLAFGPDGLLYVTDQQNHAIRSIDPVSTQVCTVAGVTGLPGYHDSNNESNEPPTFSYPNGIAVDADGTIYVSENGNSVVRRIRRGAGNTVLVDTFAGLTTVVENRDRQKKLNSTRQGIDAFRNGDAIDEAGFRSPDDILIAPDGSIYVADSFNHSVRRIVRNGNEVIVETVAGNGVPGFADGQADKARFNLPVGLALSADGRLLFVADLRNHRIRVIDLQTRRVSTFAGNGNNGGEDGPAIFASFSQPIGLALDFDGVLYVSEFGGNRIRRVDAEGNVTSFAGGGATKFRDGPGVEANFNLPRGLAIDRQRRILYVADYENHRIRTITLP